MAGPFCSDECCLEFKFSLCALLWCFTDLYWLLKYLHRVNSWFNKIYCNRIWKTYFSIVLFTHSKRRARLTQSLLWDTHSHTCTLVNKPHPIFPEGTIQNWLIKTCNGYKQVLHFVLIIRRNGKGWQWRQKCTEASEKIKPNIDLKFTRHEL